MNLMPKTVLPTSPSPLWMKTDTMVKMHGHFSPQFWPQSLMWSEVRSWSLVVWLLFCCVQGSIKKKRKNSLFRHWFHFTVYNVPGPFHWQLDTIFSLKRQLISANPTTGSLSHQSCIPNRFHKFMLNKRLINTYVHLPIFNVTYMNIDTAT